MLGEWVPHPMLCFPPDSLRYIWKYIYVVLEFCYWICIQINNRANKLMLGGVCGNLTYSQNNNCINSTITKSPMGYWCYVWHQFPLNSPIKSWWHVQEDVSLVFASKDMCAQTTEHCMDIGNNYSLIKVSMYMMFNVNWWYDI